MIFIRAYSVAELVETEKVELPKLVQEAPGLRMGLGLY
jgi:hypothetical protein